MAQIRPFSVQVLPLWRRSLLNMVQVGTVFGAGVILEGEPAPLEGVEWRFAEQVGPLFRDLLQKISNLRRIIEDNSRKKPDTLNREGWYLATPGKGIATPHS